MNGTVHLDTLFISQLYSSKHVKPHLLSYDIRCCFYYPYHFHGLLYGTEWILKIYKILTLNYTTIINHLSVQTLAYKVLYKKYVCWFSKEFWLSTRNSANVYATRQQSLKSAFLTKWLEDLKCICFDSWVMRDLRLWWPFVWGHFVHWG